jgi:hypothetical protein
MGKPTLDVKCWNHVRVGFLEGVVCQETFQVMVLQTTEVFLVMALKAEILQTVVLQVEALQALQAVILQGVALQTVALQVVALQMVLQVMDLQEEIIHQMRRTQKTHSQTKRTT